ncbi:MAG TPA: Hsp70 family protein [Pyrinomonadaceae bacterium]|jgi:hypothetical chaperone protein
MQFIGIDFGTSNSLASLVRNGKIEFVRFPDDNTSNPTILYFPVKSKQHRIGNDAVYQYLSHLEENPQDAGRLMLSIKTLLPEANFDYTTVVGFGNQRAEDLAARFLGVLKQYAEKQFSAKFDGVILGRPVNFNELAVKRLENAALQVGFKEVIFWLEPVAAALAHEITTTEDELVCVVDLGGGTSDICIIETSPRRSLMAQRSDDIKATSGVSQAGDELNSRIMRQKLAPRFGAGSTYMSLGKEMPFPIHLIERISRWHRVNLLKNSRDIGDILEISRSSDRPEDVKRLLNLIRQHYGFELFRAIDEAKKQLSGAPNAFVKFRSLDLNEAITIEEFEGLTSPVAEKIKEAINESLRLASVTPANIKRVLLTGGTSQIPMLSRMVIKIFGEDKIIRPDYFSSVATGLGYVASRFK